MTEKTTIEIEHGSDLANHMYDFQLGEIAYALDVLARMVRRNHKGDEVYDDLPVGKEHYAKILDIISESSDRSCEEDGQWLKLIAIGQVAVSLAMSFIATLENIQTSLDIDSLPDAPEM